MKTLFYFTSINEITKNLIKDLCECAPHIRIDTADSLQVLSKMLRQPLNNISVIVALPNDQQDLNDLIQMMPLLDNIKIILILPDRNRDTISLGTRLAPSFLTYIDNDAKDVISVLQKIQRNEQRPKNFNGYKKINQNNINGDRKNEKKITEI